MWLVCAFQMLPFTSIDERPKLWLTWVYYKQFDLLLFTSVHPACPVSFRWDTMPTFLCFSLGFPTVCGVSEWVSEWSASEVNQWVQRVSEMSQWVEWVSEWSESVSESVVGDGIGKWVDQSVSQLINQPASQPIRLLPKTYKQITCFTIYPESFTTTFPDKYLDLQYPDLRMNIDYRSNGDLETGRGLMSNQ